MKLFLSILIGSIFLSCQSENRENSRAYIEGKIISSAIDYKIYKVKIVQDDIIVAETFLENDGTFKISGPVSYRNYSLISGEKIKSFQLEQKGLSLSADEFKIEIPKEFTYLKFTEIVLQK